MIKNKKIIDGFITDKISIESNLQNTVSIESNLQNTMLKGVGIKDIIFNDDYSLTIILTNGTEYTTEPLRGEIGQQGPQGIQGIQGNTGPKGEDGHTPVRGIDYWTTADKNEVINNIIEIFEWYQTADDIVAAINEIRNDIPLNVSELINDSGYITEADLDGYLEENDISLNSDVSNVLTEVFSLDRYITKTTSGTIASFSDGADDAPVKSLKVDIKPMQSEGTSSPDNILPISGWDVVKVYRTDVNLWGGKRIVEGIQHSLTNTIILDEDAGTISFTNAALASNDNNFVFNVRFKENTQYTFIITYEKSTNLSSNMRLYYSDGTYDGIPAVAEAGTKETVVLVTDSGKTVESIRRINSGGRTTIYYDECCVLEGIYTADDFTPYIGIVYDITFPQTVYGGILDVTTGLLTIDRVAVTITGGCSATTTNYCRYALGELGYVQSPPNALCNILENYTGAASSLPTNSVLVLNSTAYGGAFAYIRFADADGATSANQRRDQTNNILTSLAEAQTPLVVSFKIATPQTYQLSLTEVRTLLGQNNIWADCGDVEIEYYSEDTIQ